MMVERIAAAPEKFALIQQKIPMGRAATVAEIANAVLWLCSDESTYVTGAVLSVDGGFVI
jgi:NAD(P)-dependent dehydrogenase (short-subunit alcohol dehydrogenase family)